MLPPSLLELLLQRREVAIHSVSRELVARDHRILLPGPLDLAVPHRLVEEGDRVPLAPVVVRLARRLDAVERRLEAVVAPRHEQVADVADDRV